jgi:hypothetical protein
MKRAVLTILGVAILCLLSLAMIPGMVNAYKTGYVVQSYAAVTVPTMDGAVTAGEWTDCFKDFLYSDWTKTTSAFGMKYTVDFSDVLAVYEYWVIEVLGDTTNNPGDYVQLCYDGNGDGGAAPQVDDILINYTGHSTTTVYKGTGSGWTVTTAYTQPADVQVNGSIAASPASATPHWIIELKFNKLAANGVQMLQDTWVRVAAYDADAGGQGLLTWPPTASPDVPNNWGLDQANTTDIIPEGLTVGVMVLLSSVGVLVGARYFRKQQKIRS